MIEHLMMMRSPRRSTQCNVERSTHAKELYGAPYRRLCGDRSGYKDISMLQAGLDHLPARRCRSRPGRGQDSDRRGAITAPMTPVPSGTHLRLRAMSGHI
ncbi:hypothetical protein HPP92_025586 [Vanilla planifolia]|uniref:Uncharacterized protein n=1 Tax=Vanilla planifolia TaxID=51239 RepID=A0A835UAC4_VANPL|nr:hypothetical protein HPP92_025862 [Vanilla planifolia]KAG0454282.1 hypothetical protein HPP92_025586 [Vanilla planifolia]